MFDICELCEPETLAEAKALFRANPELKVIAGGTDVLIRMQHGSLAGAGLLSLRNIPHLDEIEMLPDGTISVGATATLRKAPAIARRPRSAICFDETDVAL